MSLDAAKRRIPFQKKIGAGLTVKEFKETIEDKKITAQVGLSQSISLIASALCWELDKIEIAPIEPVIAEKRVASQLRGGVIVEPGQVAGIRQAGWGVRYGEKAITLNLHMYMGAEEYELYTIEGVPSINMKNTPSIHGDVATVAMIVNSIPKVMKAPP